MAPDVTADRIRRRAYEIWEREGRPHGREAEHWRLACEEIASEEGQNAHATSDSQTVLEVPMQQAAAAEAKPASDEPPTRKKRPAARASRAASKARTPRSRKNGAADQTST
jgi:hypothetical protein